MFVYFFPEEHQQVICLERKKQTNKKTKTKSIWLTLQGTSVIKLPDQDEGRRR